MPDKNEWAPDPDKIAKQQSVVDALQAMIDTVPEDDPAKVMPGLQKKIATAKTKLADLSLPPSNKRVVTVARLGGRVYDGERPKLIELVYEPDGTGEVEVSEIIVKVSQSYSNYAGDFRQYRDGQGFGQGKRVTNASPAVCDSWYRKTTAAAIAKGVKDGTIKVRFE